MRACMRWGVVWWYIMYVYSGGDPRFGATVWQTTLNILEAKLASISNIPARPAPAQSAAPAAPAAQAHAQPGAAPAAAQAQAPAAPPPAEAPPPPPPAPKRHAVKDDPRLPSFTLNVPTIFTCAPVRKRSGGTHGTHRHLHCKKTCVKTSNCDESVSRRPTVTSQRASASGYTPRRHAKGSAFGTLKHVQP